MQKEYTLSPYTFVLRDAPQADASYEHFNDLHHLFLKKFLAFKDTPSRIEAEKLQNLLSEILAIQSKID
ncbi:MAG: hypothetical protein JWL80_394 [Parcubacteria group bacterium]|nr:hypothetical protein [Parcubacteria group bacterium]